MEDEMDNQEIRRKIAELKGWTPTFVGGDTFCNERREYQGAINWPESIQDAWELVEESKDNDVLLKLIYKTSDIQPYHFIWFAEFREPETGNKYFAEADTAPRAICLAFIQWKERQNA